jgi:hypothetical protein
MMLTTGGQQVAAFIIAGSMLVILADFETTAPIAVGFAYLFLLSTLFLVGPTAFGRLQTLIGASPTGSTSGATGGGSGRILIR